jgi:hypothetical protein
VRISDIPVRPDGLQLDEPKRLQRRFRRSQRIPWLAFGAVIVAALLGLTGAGGPLSRAVVPLPGGSIELPTVLRRAAAETITVTIDGPGRERLVDLSDSFGKTFESSAIQPEPRSIVALPNGERWRFAIEEDLPIRVRIHGQSQAAGLIRFEIALDGGPGRRLSVLVLA